jgi:hypothetical protein
MGVQGWMPIMMHVVLKGCRGVVQKCCAATQSVLSYWAVAFLIIGCRM